MGIERLGGALAGKVGGGTECRQDLLKDIQSASVVAFQSNKSRLAGVNDGSQCSLAELLSLAKRGDLDAEVFARWKVAAANLKDKCIQYPVPRGKVAATAFQLPDGGCRQVGLRSEHSQGQSS